MRALKHGAQLRQALLVLERAPAGDGEEPGNLRGLSSQRQEFLWDSPESSGAKTRAEWAARTLPAPSTTLPAVAMSKWAMMMAMPSVWAEWAARSTKLRSGAKWATRTFLPFARHPGRRPALPVRILRSRFGFSVEFVKHCALISFHVLTFAIYRIHHL